MAAGSKKVVYAALVGNAAIAVTKLGASLYTGSSAMLSEAIHSAVDTGNQGLILLGISRSKRPADAKHPFGYGMELYFWAFVVAILIFGLGAGISAYEGIHKLLDPHPVSSYFVNYIVLGLAIAFEGVAWRIALKEFNKTRGSRGFFQAMRQSKDPTVFTVLFEDSAAMLGLFAALFGLLASQFLGLEWADGAASVVIAVILAGTAVLLAIETKGLLTGEAADADVVEGIRETVLSDDRTLAINELRTIHFGPHNVLATISVEFRDGLSVDGIEDAVTDLERKIKERHDSVTRVFIEAQGRDQQPKRMQQGGGGEPAPA